MIIQIHFIMIKQNTYLHNERKNRKNKMEIYSKDISTFYILFVPWSVPSKIALSHY